MLDRLWWEQHPDRLELELRLLGEFGFQYEKDEDAFKEGILRLRVKYEIEGKLIDLIATFPDFYPRFRFEVNAPSLELARHQHPTGKNLCLIGRSTHNWNTTDTLAGFLKNRVPLVLNANKGGAVVADVPEEQQGEPFSTYYAYITPHIILVDSAWPLCTDDSGRMELLIEPSPSLVLRGMVKTIYSQDKTILNSSDYSLPAFSRSFEIPWFQVTVPIPECDIEKVVRSKVGPPRMRQLGDWSVEMVAIQFPEEVQHRKYGAAWFFFVNAQRKKDTAKFLVRAGRAGQTDFQARIPELLPLQQHSVSMVGLGGIGAPAAIEFAKAGVGELRLMDYDIIEPGTTVRWPYGLSSAGYPKATLLEAYFRSNYPFTKIQPYIHRLGAAPGVNLSREGQVLTKFVDGANLVFDASVELGVHNLLSEVCRSRGIPFVYAYATAGGWGGLVARIDSTTRGCWQCLQHALYTDHTIQEPIFDPTAATQPTGCADPTFTATGFDLAEVALEAVRTSISTLCSGSKNAYPKADWDVAVLSLRDATGTRIPPRWDTHKLERHPSCQCH